VTQEVTVPMYEKIIADLLMAWSRANGHPFTDEAKRECAEAIDRIEEHYLGCSIFMYALDKGWVTEDTIKDQYSTGKDG